MACAQLPKPQLDALPLGAHRLFAAETGLRGTCGHVEDGASGAEEVAAAPDAAFEPASANANLSDAGGRDPHARVDGESPEVLTDEALFQACGVRIGFAGRRGGTSAGPFASLNCGLHVGDDEGAVLSNRKRLLEALGIENAYPIIPTQVHGTRILHVKSGDSAADVQRDALDGADALLVEVPGVAALLNSADCLPLILVSPDGHFSVVHAGWRGAVARIASKAACALAQSSGCDPSLINAYIGPHIRVECFEVGEDVAKRFADEFGSQVLADARHVSLSAAVTVDLLSAGLVRERIADSEQCTVCNPDRYFSYRASGGTCGRQAALAARVS